MKENKNVSIEFRLTPKEKELIKEFAREHNLSVSEFIRMACFNQINKGDK